MNYSKPIIYIVGIIILSISCYFILRGFNVIEKYSDIDKYSDSTIKDFPESILDYQKGVKQNWIYNYFDKCYVIYLDKRKQSIEQLFKYLNIEPTYFSAIHKDIIKRDMLIKHNLVDKDSKLNEGRIACHLSHLYILQEFLKNDKIKTCLIFEDDLAIPKNLKRLTTRFNHVMKNVPKDWDVINFGGCWDHCENRTRITNELYKSTRAQCRHCYAVSKNGARIILTNTLPMSVRPGDFSITALAEKGLLNMYAASPSLFFQNREEFGTNLGNTALIQKECIKDINNRLINLERRLSVISNDNIDNDYAIYYINSTNSLDKDNYMQSQFENMSLQNINRIEEYSDNFQGKSSLLSHKKAINHFVKGKFRHGLILNDNIGIYLLYINMFNVDEIINTAPRNWDIILLYDINNYNTDDLFNKYDGGSEILGYIINKTMNIKKLKGIDSNDLDDLFKNLNTYSFSQNLLYNSNYYKDHEFYDDNNTEEIESVSIINNIINS